MNITDRQDLVNLPDKKFGPIDNVLKREIADCRERRQLERAILRVSDTESMDQILEILELWKSS